MTAKARSILTPLLILGVVACNGTGIGRPAAASSGGAIVPTAAMNTPRSGHTATRLPDGRVLIAGGMERNGVYFNSAELYSPATGKFTSTHGMSVQRVGHTATLLRNGKVLIAGGFDGGGVLSSAEVYDPAMETFAPTGRMASGRGDFTATLLPSGKVLVAGGEDNTALSGAEIYDPEVGKFSTTGNMASGRTMHTATLLPDGTVLITGGGDYQNPLATAETYDPANGTFSSAGRMSVPRYKHGAELLPDGNALILGGSDGRDWRGQYVSAEVYHLKTHNFRPASNMITARFKIPGAVVRLRTGEILIAGGGQRGEVYDEKMGAFKAVDGEMDGARFYSTTTLLANGQVLIAGGYDNHGTATANAWIYKV